MLAAELFAVDQIDKIGHRASMERKADKINISFLPVTPDTFRVQLEQVEITSSDITPPTSSDIPAFGPRLNTNAKDIDFEENQLPFN